MNNQLTHQIKAEDFIGKISQYNIASSTGGTGKQLTVCSVINENGWIVSYFEVRTNTAVSYREKPKIEGQYSHLKDAIEKYNSL